MFYRYAALFIICAIFSGSELAAWGNFWGQGGNGMEIYKEDKKVTKKNYPNPHRTPKIINRRATDLNSPNFNDTAPTTDRYGKGSKNTRPVSENYHSWKR